LGIERANLHVRDRIIHAEEIGGLADGIKAHEKTLHDSPGDAAENTAQKNYARIVLSPDPSLCPMELPDGTESGS
jgi:hypothetical protein